MKKLAMLMMLTAGVMFVGCSDTKKVEKKKTETTTTETDKDANIGGGETTTTTKTKKTEVEDTKPDTDTDTDPGTVPGDGLSDPVKSGAGDSPDDPDQIPEKDEK